MKRYLCVLSILVILLILGLYKMGIVLFEYTEKTEEEMYATIESSLKEKQYTYSYEAKINRKKFLLYVKKSNPKLQIGDIIKFKGTYKALAKSRNEGGFDYSLYLKTKKIYGSFNIESFEKCQKNNSLSIKFKKMIANIKEDIKSTINSNMKKENSALLIGLLIGEKEEIDSTVIDNFRDASLSHLLAISGAHFSYIIIMINYINKKLKHKTLGQIISIIAILFFINLTGKTPSVIRAGANCILTILASLLHRKCDIWTNLATSVLVQIIINPYVIFDIGLILSYGGVIGIIVFYNTIQKKIKSKIISVTLAANLVIMPIMMYNYNTISLSFVISNLCASILLGPIIILGYISIICKLRPIFIFLDILLTLLQTIAKICSNIPFSKIYIATPSIISIIIYYLLLAYLMKKNTNKKKKIKFISLMVLIILISNLNFQVLKIKLNGGLLINFIDVGQGDSSLIRIDDLTLMIDSGGTTNSNNGYDIGKNTLLPYLLDKKITKLDYIMISHFDADHSQAFIYVLNNIKVKNAIISKQAKSSKLYQEFLKICKKNKINIIEVKSGDVLEIGKNKNKIKLQILHPTEELIQNNPLNNNSIVAKLIYNKLSILFTGDIEEIAENQILSRYTDTDVLKSTILKVAHHGSKTSSTIDFINLVNPKIALIGVGENNKFNHPSEIILNNLKTCSSKIYRTDLNGEISITVNRKGKVIVQKHIN